MNEPVRYITLLVVNDAGSVLVIAVLKPLVPGYQNLRTAEP